MTYLTFFPSHTRAMPRFSALASAILRQAEELQAVIPSLNRAYAIPTAAGEALSAAGSALGIPRPPDMTDTAYRTLLQTKSILWTWDGTNAAVPDLLSGTFPDASLCDNADGSVTITPGSAELPSGVPLKELFPVPAGIRVITT